MPIGSIIGGVIGQNGAQQGGDMAWNAALRGRQDAQDANRQNLAEALRGRNALSPWTSAGVSALNKITMLLGLGHTYDALGDGSVSIDNSVWKADQDRALSEFSTSPGYSFRKQEGINALDRSGSAKGMSLSGAKIKAVQGFGDNLAADEWRNYMGDLTGLSTGGMGATENANSTSAGLVSGGSNALVQGGNMLAQGGAARGSAYASGANALASGIGRGVQNGMFLASLGAGGFGGGGLSASDAWTKGVARGKQAGYL